MTDSDTRVLEVLEDAATAEDQLEEQFGASTANISTPRYPEDGQVDVRMEWSQYDTFEAASAVVADLALEFHGWSECTNVTCGASTETGHVPEERDDDIDVRAWVAATFEL